MNGLFDPIFSGFEVIFFMFVCFTMGITLGGQKKESDRENEN